MENYRKLKTLGRGRYGEIWLVEQEDGSLAAMKRIFIETEEPDSQEVRVLEKLQHPHIIQYHESFIENSYLNIVMDYAEGGDLSSRIKLAKENKFTFNESQVWRWFTQLTMALGYIHSLKIIHRDLKTQNVFLTKDGGLQLGDFGFSKFLHFSDEMANTGVGTPYYLSPEICRGQAYDCKADIWSLGCIVYELCTLSHPFDGENIAVVINAIINTEPAPLSDEYSDNLKTLVRKLLCKNPDERPTVSEILSSPEFMNREENTSSFSLSSRKIRKPYKKEISINIPSVSTPAFKPEPNSAQFERRESEPVDPANIRTATNANNCKEMQTRSDTCSTAHVTHKRFTFSQSLLKQLPNSPIRPMLMGDFLKRKLGGEIYERVKRVLINTKDPEKLLREEPWIISDICGEENLSIVDVGIAFNAFATDTKIMYPPTSTNKLRKERVFPLVSKKDEAPM